jgi:hypothetical protein
MIAIDEAFEIAEAVLVRNKEFRESQPHAVDVADYLDNHMETKLARALLELRPVVEAAKEWRHERYHGARTWRADMVAIVDSTLVRAVDALATKAKP